MRAGTSSVRKAVDLIRVRRLALLSLVLTLAVAGVRPSGVVPRAPGEADRGYTVAEAGTDGSEAGTGSAFAATNPAQGLELRFEGSGVAVRPLDAGGWRVGLALTGIGREERVEPIETIAVTTRDGEVAYSYVGHVSAAFENAERGLGIAVSIPEPLSRPRGPEPLRVDFTVSNARIEASADGASADALEDGRSVLRFDQVRSSDATGRLLPTRLAVGRTLSLLVEDADAVYPITTELVVSSVGRAAAISAPALQRDGEPVPPSGPTLAPPNDTCAGALILDLDTVVFGDSASATDDYHSPPNSSCYSGIGQSTATTGFYGLGKDVVYSFTAPDDGAYSFRGSGYTGGDLLVYLTGTCPTVPPAQTVSCIAGANRTGVGRDEEILCRSLTAGQEVHVIVDDRNFLGGGPFRLEVTRCRRETEPNEAPGTATPGVCGIEGSFAVGAPLADVDFFSIGTWTPGSRVFALADSNAANNFDVDMRVTTTADTLEFDDADADSPFGPTSATSDGTPLPGGAAFLRVNSRSTTVFEPYRLYAAVQPPAAQATAESEPNNSVAQANSSVADYFAGALSSAADVDVFSFQASAGEVVFLGLDGDPLRDGTPVNAALALLDSSGAVLLAVNDGNALSNVTPGTGSLGSVTPSSPGEAIAWRATYTGTHYARVTGSAAGDWLLSITRNCVAATPTDLEVTKTAPPTVGTGSTLSYAIQVHNGGANDASAVELLDTIPAGTTFQSLSTPADWTCTTPAVGGTGDVSCSTPALAAGATASFTLFVRTDWCAGDGTIVSNTVDVTSATVEIDPGDNSATATTTLIDPGTCDDGNACTLADVCQAGVCTGTNPKSCPASNNCHGVGTCDPQTGDCSDPVLPNGTACNDNNGCTQTDTCQSGTCTGANPVVCTAQDQCHVAGVCAPATGTCSNPTQPNNTACNDGTLCTQTDTCQAGVCTGSNPVVCTAQDQCHDIGVCASGTGVCSNPPKANNTPCNDNSLCTQSDTCQAGVCTGSNPVSCANVCTPGVDCPVSYEFTFAPDTYLDEPHNIAANGSAGNNAGFDQFHPGQLIDGARGANAWNANLGNGASYEWVGWSFNDPTVIVQFPAVRSFESVTVGLNRNEGVLIFEPQEIQVSFSVDGTTFGPVTQFTSLPVIPPDSRADLTLTFTRTVARYVKVTFVNSGQWTFVDEIAFGAADQCHAAGTCDPGTGVCSHPTLPNGTACDDGNQCTQSDTCQAGTCQPGTPLSCSAQDDCHEVGVCNPTTGVCSNPVRADNSPCNDHNGCTQTDTCQAGACQGGNPVTCNAQDQCHVAGVCDPGSGICSNPPKANGEPCTDGSMCTQTDSCQGGVCLGANPVVCPTPDQCHLPGTCDAGTGSCSNPPKTDGSTCNDGNECTQTDTCQTGSCLGANPVLCTAQDDCHVAGACDTLTGLCSNPAATDGTSCSDDNLCTLTDACQSGVCTGANPVSCATVCTPGVDCPSDYKFSHDPDVGTRAYFDEPHNVAANGVANDNTGFDQYYAGQLTDGIRGVDDWNADTGSGPSYEWVGWAFDDPSITFRFPSARTLSAISIGLNRNESDLIFEPDQIDIELGLDGTTFGTPISFKIADATLPVFADDTREDVTLSFPSQIARYVRITFHNPEKWTFVDEVAFGAPDQCHDAGTCNPATGVCSNPAKPDGTACSDGDLCTVSDACHAGACEATPVVCTAQDQCHEAGVCDSVTGQCSNPAKIDGSACSDGNLCTQADTCISGACEGADPVVCPAPAACHLAGACVPATGVCTAPLAPDGSTCEDGLYCTVAESCTAGACGGGSPRECTDPTPCNVGTCDEDNDRCNFQLVNAGDPDGDGVPACIDSCPAQINGGSDAGCAAPPAGLVAWWPLDETAGTSSEDIAGTHDGVRTNSPTPVAGKVAGALSLDGIDDYVEVPDDAELDFGIGDFSVDAWIRTSALPIDQDLLLDKRREESAGGPQGWALFLYNGTLWLQLASGGGAQNFNSGIAVNDGAWHHVAVTIDRDDPAGGKFYVDYVAPLPPVVTFDPTGMSGTLDNDLPLRMGRRSDSAGNPGFYSGEIDEVELFRGVALAAADVEAIATAGSAGKCKPTQLDTDHDGAGDVCDTDDDGDGAPDASDCAPLDATTQSAPGEVSLVRISPAGAGSNEVEWSSASGGSSSVYDVVTGPLSALPVGSAGGSSETGACGVSGQTTTVALDPPLGTGAWVIVRARNQCGAGSYGAERDNQSPPYPLFTPRQTTTCP